MANIQKLHTHVTAIYLFVSNSSSQSCNFLFQTQA